MDEVVKIVVIKDGWDYASIIINGLLIIGVIVSIIVFLYTKRKDRKEKSIELAKYYKDNVLSDLSIIIFIKQIVGIANIFENKNIYDMRNFDDTELVELFTKSELNKIENAIYDSENVVKLLIFNKKYNLGIDSNCDVKKKLSSTKKVAVNDDVISRYIRDLETNVLNSLEYFAMYFTERLADKDAVIASLRPTYLMAVKYLYYNIAKDNKRGAKEKYYTHVISLFKDWIK